MQSVEMLKAMLISTESPPPDADGNLDLPDVKKLLMAFGQDYSDLTETLFSSLDQLSLLESRTIMGQAASLSITFHKQCEPKKGLWVHPCFFWVAIADSKSEGGKLLNSKGLGKDRLLTYLRSFRDQGSDETFPP